MATEEDKDRAVEKLESAGDNLQLLVAALDAARFLEDIPGDHRQKLRGNKRLCRFLFTLTLFSRQNTLSQTQARRGSGGGGRNRPDRRRCLTL